MGLSAGHIVQYFVMDQGLMVGYRRSPGATILGGEFGYHFCRPSPVSRRLAPCFLMDWAAEGRKSLFFTRRGAAALSTPHDVAVPLPPIVAAPVCLGCRDLLHSALVSGRLCQVRAARHCSFLDSVLELLTNP